MSGGRHGRLQIPFRGYSRASLFSVIQSKRHQGARSNHRWHSFHSPSRRRLPSSPSFSGLANRRYILPQQQQESSRSVPSRNTAKTDLGGRERVRKLYISNMIAKFHSAPGHSMETTLTINIPPPERIRAAKGERLREKQKEKDKIQVEAVQGLPGRTKEREKEDEIIVKEEERVRKDDREREREKLERERRVCSSFVGAGSALMLLFQALAERGTTYKDKLVALLTHKLYIELLFYRFQKMREKYDRVTLVRFSNLQSFLLILFLYFRHTRPTIRNLIFSTKK